MSKRTYEDARAEAQRKANESGHDYGVEDLGGYAGFTAFLLPQRKNRYGHELRCEVVSCEDHSRCKPGHGPVSDQPLACGWQR